MNGRSILKMTIHENYSGQILWLAFGVGLITLVLLALLSGSALSHQDRLVDVASYFLIDIVPMATSVFMGSFLFSRDFSNRGIAEIAIPGGQSRISLFFWRSFSHSLCLFVLLVILALVRLLAFALADSWNMAVLHSTTLMIALSTTKTLVAFSLAAFLGSFARPMIALIGTFGIFGIGHFSSGIQGLHGMIQEAQLATSVAEEFLFKALRVWNPNLLVLESFRGAWEQPDARELAMRLAWGFSAILVFLSASFLGIRRRDIGAFKL
jgi:hypothetical protein